MFKLGFYFIIICLSISYSLFPQVVKSVAPLQPGNLWSYNEQLSSAKQFCVLDSVHIINGKQYNIISSYTANSITSPYYRYCRLTTDSFYVWYDEGIAPIDKEYKYFKLNLKKGDSWTQLYGIDTIPLYHIVTDTGYYPWFGELIPVKSILVTDSVLVEDQEIWSEKYGLLREFREWHAAWLWGCVIDGVVYGDTTLVEVEDSPLHQRKDFTLFQNYPNPFNPSTKITYTVPEQSYITIKVFNSIGQEVVTLVEETKETGVYSTEFSGLGLPSGIYICKMIAMNNSKQIFNSNKKMLLIK